MSLIPSPRRDAILILRGAGLDCVGNLVTDGYIRPIMINGEPCGSLVDLMTVFTDAKNPRQYWKDHKRRLIKINPHVVGNLYQLKLKAADGKMRLTDVAPWWALIQIALSIPTEKAAELRHRVGKFSDAQIRYRLMNVANGMEWAADTIHLELAEWESPEYERPFADWGYMGHPED